MCLIGQLPDTLAYRCIVIRMHRKQPEEHCERLRGLKTEELRRKCARFALDQAERIATAEPVVPEILHDRAGDICEPLLALAEAAGGEWPERAQAAAVGLTAAAQESYPVTTLLFDTYVLFLKRNMERIFSRDLVAALNRYGERPWRHLHRGKELTEAWLAGCLRPYGMRPMTMRIGEEVGRGYVREELEEALRRYLPKNEARALLEEVRGRAAEAEAPSSLLVTIL
jgi:putative DNA primase/helicase